MVADFSLSHLFVLSSSACVEVGFSSAVSPPASAIVEVCCGDGFLTRDARLSFNFFSPCADILVNSETNDCPQKALRQPGLELANIGAKTE